MKYLLFTTILLFSLVPGVKSQVTEKPDVDPQLVLHDFKSWWNYHYSHVSLSANFTGFDTNSMPLDKEAFLTQLSSGEYIALRLSSKDPGMKLQLYKLNASVNTDISVTAKRVGLEAYSYYKMEGTPLPGNGFTDIAGKVYDKESLQGKVLVLKCWFIHCQSCVEEMPALNQAIKPFKKREDVVFVSLATDTPEALKTFLKKIKFDYAVVAEQRGYMTDQLQVSGYPTHFIIDKKGMIAKVTSRYEEMLVALEEELKK